MIKLIGHFVDSPTIIARFARLFSVVGLAWIAIQVADRFFPTLLPNGSVFLSIFGLSSLSVFLAIELWVETKQVPSKVGLVDAEGEFSDGIIQYAMSLSQSTPPKDQAILELHRRSSRLLHLTGNNKQREQLGRIALGSAVAAEDNLTQAAVLIDDLGWGVFQQGKIKDAKENIIEGLKLLACIEVEEEQLPMVLELTLKGKRHLAGINFNAEKRIDKGLASIEELRSLAAKLPEGLQGMHVAQLHFLEASFINKYFASNTQENTVLDKTGEKYSLYKKGVENVKKAEDLFKNFADIDRQVKALNLYVKLLKFGGNENATFIANTRLDRLKKIVSRKF